MSGSLLSEFRRVTLAHPCSVCGKPDWCMSSRDNTESPSRVICKRVESARKWGNAGWLHTFGAHVHERKPFRPAFTVRADRRQDYARYEAISARSVTLVDPKALLGVARTLSVSEDSLRRLGVGYVTPADLEAFGNKAKPLPVLSFPMRDASGQVCGIRLRDGSGFKYALNGSRNGLFIPEEISERLVRLLVCEGETDAAAMLDLGFDAVGKPGAGNADDEVVRYTRRTSPGEIVIVADNDSIGHKKAAELAQRLATSHPIVRVIRPPDDIKDAREWKRRGATTATINAAIHASKPVTLAISVNERGCADGR